ncbi:MAG TPA: bifunctional riboflavin kinase/FAD synthetase [Alphaproteobacteria bacterium]|nr:bifunctional riboflavin kinase/FAD synthetase [Alphaproteobacteria bacterium]
MTLYRSHRSLPPAARGAVVAIGNFDGVHRGHQHLIAQAAAEARRLGAPLGVLTFEPHPRRLFRPDDPPFRLTPLRTKLPLLRGLGVDRVYALRFDRAFSLLDAEAFVRDVLVEGLGVAHVAVGRDFEYGHKRGGSAATLAAHSEFGVTIVEKLADPDGDTVSSTAVRHALRDGRPAEAARLLGRPFAISGFVRRGDQRGRTIGFPTANLTLGPYLRPGYGVYAVRARLADGRSAGGVANLGIRPTVGGLRELFEIHLFDFEGDLYGRRLEVELLHFIRPERKFDSFDALRAQIAQDAQAARGLLAK